MIPRAAFGRTGHESTRVIFGAAALGAMSQERADATMELVDAAGVNHIDTAAGYGDSEVRLKPFLSEHRERFFLATKTGDRTADAARASLERSLTRMGVDSVDLIQLHNLVEDDEWNVVHRSGGALEALLQARDEGLVAHIGVTGHGLRIAGMHLRSLEAFDYASVLFPVNHSLMKLDGYRSDVEALVEVCRERGVAMQTIKSIARRRWQGDEAKRFSWYEPITDADAIGRAVRYVLAEDGWFLDTTSDARLLPPIFDAANGALTRPTATEMENDIADYDVTPIFDGGQLERI